MAQTPTGASKKLIEVAGKVRDFLEMKEACNIPDDPTYRLVLMEMGKKRLVREGYQTEERVEDMDLDRLTFLLSL